MESAPIDTGIIDTSKLREKWKQREKPDWEKRCDELERRIEDLLRLINIMSGQPHKLSKDAKEQLDGFEARTW